VSDDRKVNAVIDPFVKLLDRSARNDAQAGFQQHVACHGGVAVIRREQQCTGFAILVRFGHD
jgi:hypothetical protein